MVKVIKNVPNIIGINPAPEIPINISSNPLQAGNTVLNEVDGYIKLVERIFDLYSKFQNFKGSQATPVNNSVYVTDMANIQPQPSDINEMPTPNKPLKDNNEVGVNVMETINIDFIVSVLEQIDTIKKGITVREVIDFINSDRKTVERIIKMNMGG